MYLSSAGFCLRMAEDGGMYQDSLPKQLAALISESSVNASISADSNPINAGQML